MSRCWRPRARNTPFTQPVREQPQSVPPPHAARPYAPNPSQSSARLPARPSGTVLTARHLGRVLALVVLLAAAEELLAAAAGAHVLNAHVDALVDDPPVDLRAGRGAAGRGTLRPGRSGLARVPSLVAAAAREPSNVLICSTAQAPVLCQDPCGSSQCLAQQRRQDAAGLPPRAQTNFRVLLLPFFQAPQLASSCAGGFMLASCQLQTADCLATQPVSTCCWPGCLLPMLSALHAPGNESSARQSGRRGCSPCRSLPRHVLALSHHPGKAADGRSSQCNVEPPAKAAGACMHGASRRGQQLSAASMNCRRKLPCPGAASAATCRAKLRKGSATNALSAWRCSLPERPPSLRPPRCCAVLCSQYVLLLRQLLHPAHTLHPLSGSASVQRECTLRTPRAQHAQRAPSC